MVNPIEVVIGVSELQQAIANCDASGERVPDAVKQASGKLADMASKLSAYIEEYSRSREAAQVQAAAEPQPEAAPEVKTEAAPEAPAEESEAQETPAA